MTLPRVIYLSSGNIGKEFVGFLKDLPCDLVLVETDNKKIDKFPDYDLGLSFLYTHRIPASEFEVPYRWVNFHPGMLPEYGGRNLAYHAIINGERYFGASVHYMDKDFDTGEIIEVMRFPIMNRDMAGNLVHWSHKLLIDLFFKYVPQLLNGKVESMPQLGGHYYPKEELDDMVILTPEQKTLIRALTVEPKFYPKTFIGDKRYKIILVEG